MVSWFVKTVVIIHSTHVFAHGTLPPLLDATADELIAGLDAGDFTSLNLVEVSTYSCHYKSLTSRPTSDASTKSIQPSTWSPRSIPMRGRLRRNWTKNVPAERFGGELAINIKCVN
jgi:hypothetical protein